MPMRAAQAEGRAITLADIRAAAGRISGAVLRTPTLESLGINDMNVADWYGVFVPKGTPADRIAYLEQAVRKAMSTADMKTKVNQSGSEVVGNARSDFIKTVDKEIADWGAVVKASGVKVD